jgi:pimeloyl-ACP methyl ester carboxylesterase
MLVMPSRLAIRHFIRGASMAGYSSRDAVQEQMIVGMTSMKRVSFMWAVFTDAELGQLRPPTLLLIGDHEIMYEPRTALDLAAALIPGLQAKLVENAGHMLNGDQPAIVDKLILDFLSA